MPETVIISAFKPILFDEMTSVIHNKLIFSGDQCEFCPAPDQRWVISCQMTQFILGLVKDSDEKPHFNSCYAKQGKTRIPYMKKKNLIFLRFCDSTNT